MNKANTFHYMNFGMVQYLNCNLKSGLHFANELNCDSSQIVLLGC